jgi:hypothetical protein
LGSEVRTFRKSGGRSCATPPEIALIIRLLAQLSGFCFVRYVQGSIIPSTGRVRSRNDMGGLTPLLDRLFPQSSSASRLTAGASGFFTFNHKGERPRPSWGWGDAGVDRGLARPAQRATNTGPRHCENEISLCIVPA